jgi:iron complex outermembrane receptor protein
LRPGDATGNQLPYAPALTATVKADYTFRTPAGALDLEASDYYSDHYFAEADNRPTQRAYDYVGASLTWQVSDGPLSLQLWGNNLLNKAVGSQYSTENIGYVVAYANPPRTYGIRASYSFR